LGGTINHNVKARWKEQINKQKLLGKDIHGTQEYMDQPEFYDHSYLDLLNRHRISLGWGQMFDFIVKPRDDNGEIFLSKHFEQQQKRNSTVG
jgi:hypothetical protein